MEEAGVESVRVQFYCGTVLPIPRCSGVEQGHLWSRLEAVALSTTWVLTHTTLLARKIFVVA